MATRAAFAVLAFGFLLTAAALSFDAAARASVADANVPRFVGAAPQEDARIDGFLATRDMLSTIGGATLAIGLVLLAGAAIARRDPASRRAALAAVGAGVVVLVFGPIADIAGIQVGLPGEIAISLAIPLAVAYALTRRRAALACALVATLAFALRALASAREPAWITPWVSAWSALGFVLLAAALAIVLVQPAPPRGAPEGGTLAS